MPREIIREIEVSRVVTVEKPVEVLVREIVHVPFYTNDAKLLNISNPKGSSRNENSDEKNTSTKNPENPISSPSPDLTEKK